MFGTLNSLRAVLVVLGLCVGLSVGAVMPAIAQGGAQTPGPIKVTVGAYVNDIQAIDLQSHSYVVDLYVWFRWTDRSYDPTETFEFMNTFDPEAHVQTVLYDEPQEQPDGSLYAIVRHQGAFSNKFDVAQYPFDNQAIIVAIEDSEYSNADLVFSLDDKPLTLNPDIRLPGYTVGKSHARVTAKSYATNFGDLSEPAETPYSRASLVVPIKRPAVSGGVKVFLPVVLIILCAMLALMLDPVHVDARIGLSITALLTLVATQFTAAGNLPEVAYLTMLDQIYIASYIFILVVIALVVRGTRLDEQGALQGAVGATERLARGGPVAAAVITLCYLMSILAILFFNLI